MPLAVKWPPLNIKPLTDKLPGGIGEILLFESCGNDERQIHRTEDIHQTTSNFDP